MHPYRWADSTVTHSYPKLLLRRTESVAKRILTNWLTFYLHTCSWWGRENMQGEGEKGREEEGGGKEGREYLTTTTEWERRRNYLKLASPLSTFLFFFYSPLPSHYHPPSIFLEHVGQPLYMLFRAVKNQLEKGIHWCHHQGGKILSRRTEADLSEDGYGGDSWHNIVVWHIPSYFPFSSPSSSSWTWRIHIGLLLWTRNTNVHCTHTCTSTPLTAHMLKVTYNLLPPSISVSESDDEEDRRVCDWKCPSPSTTNQ